VQARHYDGHDYMPEKRRALELLFGEIGGTHAAQPEAESDGGFRRV